MSTDERYPEDGKYRIEAGLSPGAEGLYTLRLFCGDEQVSLICKFDREDGIRELRERADRHRNYTPAVEVIEL